MEISRTRSIFACILLLVGSPLWATEYAHTSTVAFVYPTSDGNFVVGFNTNHANCSNGSLPIKYHSITVGQNSVTADGAKKMYAALLVALSAGLTVSIHFDNGTSYCYVNRLSIEAADD